MPDPSTIESPQKKQSDDDSAILLWQSHVSHRFAGLISNDGWTYSQDPADFGTYISSTGVKLGPNELRGLALTFASGVEADLRANAQQMLSEEISVDEWKRRANNDIEDEYLVLAALGAGGFDKLTDEDLEAVEGVTTTPKTLGSGVADAEARLDDFASQLTSEPPAEALDGEVGTVGDDEAVTRRAGSYGHGYPIFEQAQSRAAKRFADDNNLKIWERSQLDPDPKVRHCTTKGNDIGCIECAAAGWQPFGAIPKPGLRQCNSSCKCSMSYSMSDKKPTE